MTYTLNLLVVITAALWSTLQAQSDTFTYCQKGVTFDSCTYDCEILLNDGTTTSCYSQDSSQPCFCFDAYNNCNDSSVCDYNEACVKLLPQPEEYYCVACEAIPYRLPRPIFVDTQHFCTNPDPALTPYPAPEIEDDYFQTCSNTTDCLEWYNLLENSGELDTCLSDSNCFCSTGGDCYSSEDCVYGEACVKLLPNAEYSYCVSCTAASRWSPLPIPIDSMHACEGGALESEGGSPTNPPPGSPTPDETSPPKDPPSGPDDPPSGTELPSTTPSGPSQDRVPPSPSASTSGATENSAICVAVKHVEHLAKKELVYNLHRRAHVLCDLLGTCATPGHMVMFENAPMMMKTYCETIVHGKCDHRIMFVNSPRMHRNLRLQSYSPGLQLTALAAQFETLVEERTLGVVLRFAM